MRRCIQLAKNGLGTTYPNPMVGSVIVYNDRIIGEGWHYKAGLPHAEVNAINSVTNLELLKEATIFISLEPCSHFGKTPPCSDLIINSGIKKVVVGSSDPNPKVAGKGIQKLIDAGCTVTSGVLADECRDLNKRFFKYHINKRPYLILKWAQTENGFMAPKIETRGEVKAPVWITNPQSRQLVHKLRSDEQSILVGTHTVLTDNPSLTTRDWQGNNPIRIVIDRGLKIPNEAAVFDGTTSTIVITEKVESHNRSCCTHEIIDFSNDVPQQICNVLFQSNIQSVLIEGGAKSLQSFIDSNLWDEAYIFTGAQIFNDGVKAPTLKGKMISENNIKGDVLRHYKNTTI